MLSPTVAFLGLSLDVPLKIIDLTDGSGLTVDDAWHARLSPDGRYLETWRDDQLFWSVFEPNDGLDGAARPLVHGVQRDAFVAVLVVHVGLGSEAFLVCRDAGGSAALAHLEPPVPLCGSSLNGMPERQIRGVSLLGERIHCSSHVVGVWPLENNVPCRDLSVDIGHGELKAIPKGGSEGIQFEPEHVKIADLVVGDVVLVRPGGRVPADGDVVHGSAAFDESMITGESRPTRHSAGDRVVAGTVSTDSSVHVRVVALGDDTALAGIQRMVQDAQQSRSRTQVLADRAAAALFYLATASAVVTMVVWSAIGEASEGVIRTVTVLVIACPHALGLAIPLVISISTATSAQAGILVKDRLALEAMRNVDAVLFDKTGTLTKGNHAVVGHAAIAGWDPDAVLALAAAAEAESEHPIARAIVAAAGARGELPVGSEFDSLTGTGVAAMVEGHRIAVGGPALLAKFDSTEPAELGEQAASWRDRGGSVLYVIRDEVVIGSLTLEDEIRPESQAAVDALHARDKQVVLITGDARQVADGVAAQLGIDEVFAEVLPQDKDSKVIELQRRGLSVAMVGDGVNDAPALARADVGLAIGAGTDVAIESAGVVLASSDPRSVIGVIDLSTATYRQMIQNLIWATGYNLLAIPIAAGAFSFAGLNLPPAAAAVAMSASTIIVAANAQLLRRLDLRPAPLPEVDELSPAMAAAAS